MASHTPVLFTLDGLVYQLDAPPRARGPRSVCRVRLAEHPTDAGFRDRVDLFAFASRQKCARRIADAFGRQVSEVLGHLALIVDATERAASDTPTQPAELSPERRAAADALLARPGLLERAAEAMSALGFVGEEAIKRLAYLVATSRLLRKPLSAIFMAPSGCGKSELLEITARLMPADAVEFLSRISPAALYYAGPNALRHKLVLVDEHAGATESDYAIRTLQSKGFLRLAVPVKGRTEPFSVHGPISLMSSTTSTDLNPENLSRCLELCLDTSPEQTRRVHKAQRSAWAGDAQALCVEVWRDAQALLEPLEVVIPFAHELTFPARTPHDRRGNQKLLGLVAAHALLCQRTRQRDRAGRVVALGEDYAVVHALLAPTLAAPDLSGRASQAVALLSERAEPLDRRSVASALGWSYNTAKKALAELVSLELATLTDAGPPARYRPLGRPSGNDLWLTTPAHFA